MPGWRVRTLWWGERRGRTPENRLVHFAATEDDAPVGALVRVKVTRAGGSSLGGEIASFRPQ